MPRNSLCWGFLGGYCPRGESCIYQHSVKVGAATGELCRFQYASQCGYRRYCGHRHLIVKMVDAAPAIQRWKSDLRPGRDMHPRVLAEWLRKAVNLFMDGDTDVRCKILETLSSAPALQQVRSCLSPGFLPQRWAPVINFPDHVIPILKILSDPIIRTHTQTKAYAKIIYAVVMKVSNRTFWAKVTTMLDEAFRMSHFQIGPQMTGMMMIFMNSIEFDSKNLENPIIRDTLPRIKAHLEALKARKYGGFLSPSMLESFKMLEKMFTQGPRLEPKPVTESRPTRSPVEEISGQLRAIQISRQIEMQEYLKTIDARFVRGDLVAEIGVLSDEQDRQHEDAAAEDNAFENKPEVKEEPMSDPEREHDIEAGPSFGEEIKAMDPYGLFHANDFMASFDSMVFKHDQGDTLFDQWVERANDPEALNMDWGKSADINSMKKFLQVTLTLFNCATTKTRLRFLSNYFLKEPCVGKFWECLKIELPTDGISLPSPRYSDHVSAIMHIMSHDDVVRRTEFKIVRTEMSKMMATQPDYLYGIHGYLRTHLKSKSCNQEMLATATKNIVIVLEGIFKLVDGPQISVEFCHEAKAFLDFAWELENRKLPCERTFALMLETAGQYIEAHAKKFPIPKEFKGCRSRQDCEAKDARAETRRDASTRDLSEDLQALARENRLMRPINDYLDDHRLRAGDEERRDDGEPTARIVSATAQGKSKQVNQENEQETTPMNNEEAIQYLEDCRSVVGSVGRGSSVQGVAVRQGLKVKFELQQETVETGEATRAVAPTPGWEDTPVCGPGTSRTGCPPRKRKPKQFVLGPRPQDRLTSEYYAQGHGAKSAVQEQQPEVTELPAPASSRLVQGRRLRLGGPAETRFSLPAFSLPAMASTIASTTEPLVKHEPATTLTGGAEPPRHAVSLPARLPPPPISQRMATPGRAFEAKGTLACGHPRYQQYDEINCPELVSKITPVCGHIALVECSNKMRHWRCKAKCDRPLRCGHNCGHACSECLEEIKVDGTGVWKHLACRKCKELLYREQKERERAEKAAIERGGEA
ncbi:hypothetical protein TWF696_003462 [Orbilia brochopaga]|uniref:C3H1-type domain-containing protein n=1 Tax=Orbilia brochopaga TaxID=3140254 RepID=A0AAV9TZK2_9PEZI